MATGLLPSPDKFIHESVNRGEFVQLSPKCQGRSLTAVASVDPEPSWTLDDLFSELQSLEAKLQATSALAPFSILSKRISYHEEATRMEQDRPFVMSVSDGLDSGSDDDDEDTPATGARFSCIDLDFSESDISDDENHLEVAYPALMVKMSPEEGVLYEFGLEHQLKIKEDIRNKLSALEWDQQSDDERSSSTIFHVEELIETRLERDSRLDKQFHRKIAEELDEHLSAVQRVHEQRFKIEERRIRDDASALEATRRALQEEKNCKAKEEQEARLKAARIEEEKQKAALETARRASEEAAAKEAARAKEAAAAQVREREANEQENAARTEESKANAVMKGPTGIEIVAAYSALKAETGRLKLHEEATNAMASSLAKDYSKYERQIYKRLYQITGTIQSVRTKARELINIISYPVWPPLVSYLKFAEKVAALGENQSSNSSTFARAHVIVLVTSQVPATMDFVLAELHKACIYTVPKHFQASGSKTKQYYKMIGYREENGKFENPVSYMQRLEGYMKLYGAMVQTEVAGVVNPHGLKEGWAWVARFLNNIPATRSSAYALVGFLEMAGFALWRKYKNQFEKILACISNSFLPVLRNKREEVGADIIKRLELYLEEKVYLHEPEGWHLETKLSSQEYVP